MVSFELDKKQMAVTLKKYINDPLVLQKCSIWQIEVTYFFSFPIFCLFQKKWKNYRPSKKKQFVSTTWGVSLTLL